MRDFFAQFQATSAERTPHSFTSRSKDHGRIEHRRCYVFDQLDCLHNPRQWPDLKAFVVIDAERTTKGKTTCEQRYYITSLAADAQRLADAIRSHGQWRIACTDAWTRAFGDDQMRARTGHAAHNLAVLKHITLNLIRLDPIPRKRGIKVRRLIAATSDEYREQLFGLRPV